MSNNLALNKIEKDINKVVLELLDAAKLNPGDTLVLGGSTSEVIGKNLGSDTNMEVGRLIIKTILPIVNKSNLNLIIQSCEHINRALVVEKEYANKNNLEIVNVIPIESAGGGLATAAMELYKDPVVVEKAWAQAGIDIGDVFIGMHLKGVGVVVRSEIKKIGDANLSMIRTRQKLIGGERAKHHS